MQTMSITRVLAALALLFAGHVAAQDFVGSEACARCHQDAYAKWRQSDHWHAMQIASDSSVLGDFSDASFDYHGVRSRFYRRNGAFLVETTNDKGQLQEFTIAYTLGFYPLQQYLVGFPDGRLQALSISWDSRPAAQGGQRWYHLYPDENITAADPLHWTGAFQNWNARCASCHTTNLAKNYSRRNNRYATQWSEINVGCEACHGAGSKHMAWARGGGKAAAKGLLVDIRRSASRQLEVCAGCHSRRSELQQRDIAADFASNYQLSPLLEGRYHADGQILDEVYEAGSFLQSRMHQNAVSCANCHEPHSNALRVQGNGLCLQCHAAPGYDTREHHFHSAGSSGAQCVNCHMPQQTYMGVDRRRDHSFRVPDPVASVVLGVPNACTQCHTGLGDQWASDFLVARTGRTTPRYPHAAAFAAARNGDVQSAPALLALARNADYPAILRATALLESRRFPSAQHLEVALAALQSPEPLLRANAVTALDYLEPARRLQLLQPLLADPAKAVRMAVARQLADLPTAQVARGQRAGFARLLDEYAASLAFNADMPESMSDLGLLHAARGSLTAAEQDLLHARKLAPAYLPAMLNLADVYRAQQRDHLGEAVLNEAQAIHPESGDVQYALGMLYVRTGRRPAALPLLRRAVALSPANAVYVHVYSVALAESGRTSEAIRVLEAALQRFPDNAQLRATLRAYQ